jgi:hypothetical protein
MHVELSGGWLAEKYYPYGDATLFTVEAWMSHGEVVWRCVVPSLNRVYGGCSGPYEALACGLQAAAQVAEGKTNDPR